MNLGSPAVVYGTNRPRISTYAADGTPLYRYTLDAEAVEGLALSFNPEGNTHQLGSGAGWRRVFTPRGFRPSLSIKWDLAMQTIVEAWESGGWDIQPMAPVYMETPKALSRIISAAAIAPALVEPHRDHGFNFYAQPDPGKAFALTDYKRVGHRGLKLDLIGTDLLNALPNW